MNYTENNDTFKYIIERIMDRYETEFSEAIENFEEVSKYIEQSHIGDFLLFETNYIRLWTQHPDNGDSYEIEYKFEPFGTWQVIAEFS